MDRSSIMRAVKSRDTLPELIVRKLLTKRGYRYRLHVTALPGSPDIVFPSRRKAIFVHGCFWHGHACPRGARVPKTNSAYWKSKIARNKTRDSLHIKALKREGWQIRIVWECQVKTPQLSASLAKFVE